MKKSINRAGWVAGCKERGEWAELCFMARVAGLGMGVSKPYGDSARYDVGVESGGRILRVQVKSTIYCRRGGEYSLNVMGPQRRKYEAGTVDLFAVYLIPVDEWYLIPYQGDGEKESESAFHSGEQAAEVCAVQGGLGVAARGSVGDLGVCGGGAIGKRAKRAVYALKNGASRSTPGQRAPSSGWQAYN